MLKSVTTVGLIGSLLAAMAVLATPVAAAAAPAGVGVEVVAVNGSGCPAGEGSARLSATGASFTIVSPAYLAAAGGPAGPLDFRRNCQVGVRFTGIEGWTYAVSRVTSTGFAYLSPGATGLTQVSLYFQGTSPTLQSSLSLVGPQEDAWVATETFDPAALLWAPCDSQRDLNINTSLRVLGGAGPTPSVMVRNNLTRGRLVWRPCAAA